MISAASRITALLGACLLGVSLGVAAPAGADQTDPAGATPTAPVPSAVPTAPVSEPAGQPLDASPSDAVPAPTNLHTSDVVVAAQGARGRLAVGDSLMVGATALMRRHGFSIHARVGRQFSTAPGIVRSYGARLPRAVVIELGTNGTVSLSTCRSVVRTAGPGRRVFLVTNRVPRSWQDSNNRTLRACDRSFAAPRVRIIDWYAASAGHPQWFAADGIHTSWTGQHAFARLIDRAVDRHGVR